MAPFSSDRHEGQKVCLLTMLVVVSVIYCRVTFIISKKCRSFLLSKREND
ncbi:hypothetical protein LptCag_2205 [Leptospirillum ferriphilum]|uniref:Uncharacterized protein n=1 Tax=Leptospirillum ferriphilum TaxID=178606 RepID=A0A094WE24_9BACT|nr:hypothetical protein LptCag_2205 [Leptospirillum ferriphilum]